MGAPYIPPPTPGPQPAKRRSPAAIVALVLLVVLCLVAVVALLKMQFSDTADESEDAQAAEQPSKQIAAVPVENGSRKPDGPIIEPLVFDDEGDEVAITIETTPEGAEVFRDGVSIGTTPIDERFPTGDVETWQIFMDGYEVEEITVPLDADFHSEVVLKEQPPERAEAKSDVAAKKVDPGSDGETKAERKERRERKKKEPKDDGGGRTVINSTTGIDLPD